MSLPEKITKRRNGAGSIYAIGAVGSPYVKIGSTRASIKQRLQSLQTGQPAKLHIVATHTVETDLHRIERQIHTFLAAERHHGEWFACMLDADALSQLILRAIESLAAMDQKTALEKEERKAQPQLRRKGKPPRSDAPWENRLAEYRSARQLSRPQLGAALGISAVTIWRWEVRAVEISHAHLLQLAQFFQVRALDIIPALNEIPVFESPSPQPSAPSQPLPEPPSATSQLTWEW